MAVTPTVDAHAPVTVTQRCPDPIPRFADFSLGRTVFEWATESDSDFWRLASTWLVPRGCGKVIWQPEQRFGPCGCTRLEAFKEWQILRAPESS